MFCGHAGGDGPCRAMGDSGVRKRASVIIGVAVVLLVTTWSRAADDAANMAERAAETSASTAEGKAFRDHVGAAFGRDHGKSLRDCATEVKAPDSSEFALLVQFDGAGVLQRALVQPSTNVAVCLQGKVHGWKVGLPPKAGTWVNLRIRRK